MIGLMPSLRVTTGERRAQMRKSPLSGGTFPRCGVSRCPSPAAESPLGIDLQAYRLDAAGRVREARLLTPAAINQRMLEQDLAGYLETRSGLEPELLLGECRHLLSSHDPLLAARLQLLEGGCEPAPANASPRATWPAADSSSKPSTVPIG